MSFASAAAIETTTSRTPRPASSSPPPTASPITPGLTVVSNLPVYVAGDFNGSTVANTGAGMVTAAGMPATKHPATPKPVDIQPVAIMADAVNLLSNKWNGKTKP